MRITGPGTWGPPADRAAARALLRRAVELGVQLIDTADAYGPGVSEELIAEALSPYDGLLIATEGAGPSGRSDAGELIGWRPNGRPDHLRSACEANRLRELGVARRAALTLPLSVGAPGALPDTDLVATLNGRLVDRYADDPLAVVAAPVELEPFHYFLIWHPRLDRDPAQQWLRDTIRSVAAASVGGPSGSAGI